MGLYLGNKQVKLVMNDIVSKLHIETQTKQDIKLLSSDNFTLKSSDDYYLTSKKEDLVK